jgi:hypothetical protein
MAPPALAEGGLTRRVSAVAVLAGAGIAAAAGFGGAAALARRVGGIGLAIGHFNSPFLVAQQ